MRLDFFPSSSPAHGALLETSVDTKVLAKFKAAVLPATYRGDPLSLPKPRRACRGARWLRLLQQRPHSRCWTGSQIHPRLRWSLWCLVWPGNRHQTMSGGYRGIGLTLGWSKDPADKIQTNKRTICKVGITNDAYIPINFRIERSQVLTRPVT